jgi:hypothetical protein
MASHPGSGRVLVLDGLVVQPEALRQEVVPCRPCAPKTTWML